MKHTLLSGTTPDAHALSPRKIRADFGLSRERMARLLDVSAKTIERWEEFDHAPANVHQRERLAQLRDIVALGTVIYTPDGLVEFLSTPLPVFGARTALQLVEQGLGEQVL